MGIKITRRVAIGSIIGGLAAGPFIIQALRKNRTLSLESMFTLFQKRVGEQLSFPREFNVNQSGWANSWPAPPAKEVCDKILAVQKRFWQNYAKLDELRFVFSSLRYVNGILKPSCHEFFDAEVWIKFGYGVEIKGTNTLGNRVHLVFNIDGEDNQPEDANRLNLAGFPIGVFSLIDARPVVATRYMTVHENGELPTCFQQTYEDFPGNFAVEPNGLYTQLTGSADSLINPTVFRHCYFSQKTGMLEMELIESREKEEKFNFAPIYDTYVNEGIKGIYFPVKHSFGKIFRGDIYTGKTHYSDINFKLIS